MGRPKGSKNKKRNKERVMDKDEVKTEVTPEVPQNPETPEEGKATEVDEVSVAIDDTPEVVPSAVSDCPNCANHGRKTRLNDNGTCLVCGFDKSKLYGAF